MEEKKQEELKVVDKRKSRKKTKDAVKRVMDEQSEEMGGDDGRPGEPEKEMSIKEMQAAELMKQREFDVCPQCGTHSMKASMQPKIPLPIGDSAILIALPFLVCVNCTNVYMPRSFLTQLLQAKRNDDQIVTPS